ncbi:hypothetical protein DSCW_18260 [Desulfosarcina widdelii]|uniref:Phage head morphogenesis domain-containing protein n=1 Tax=Desulfosarcina widdelii TaxID=947919 RepID=A0A5K7Z2C1_9BACT|nr:phage minor head protein [Desulfosarcina widdelii]BBO74409.1 hypothetical protein DSCW_18260 [Desulfosarcina widdelii]
MTPSQKQASIRARRAVMQAAGKRMPRKRRPPAQLHPRAIERAYFAAILRVTAPFFDEVSKALPAALPRILAARDSDLRADGKAFRLDVGYGDLIGEVFDGIRLNVATRVTDAAAGAVAKQFADRTSEFNRNQVDRQFEAVLGIPVLRQEKWLRPKLEAFVLQNTGMIKDITEKGAKDIQTLVMARVEAGDSTRTIEKAIRQKLDTTKRRARFIARDQVSKLNGKLTELRQVEAGVEEYIWRSTKDGADRASHLRKDGNRFRWDDPPETGHPGDDFQCRCSAEPVLDEFIEYQAKVKEAA